MLVTRECSLSLSQVQFPVSLFSSCVKGKALIFQILWSSRKIEMGSEARMSH